MDVRSRRAGYVSDTRDVCQAAMRLAQVRGYSRLRQSFQAHQHQILDASRIPTSPSRNESQG
eukprot:1704109-Pyramimonas_sp.AAC.1